MDLNKLSNLKIEKYLVNRLNVLNEKKTQYEDIINSNKIEIAELESQLKDLSENSDSTYDIFQARSSESEFEEEEKKALEEEIAELYDESAKASTYLKQIKNECDKIFMAQNEFKEIINSLKEEKSEEEIDVKDSEEYKELKREYDDLKDDLEELEDLQDEIEELKKYKNRFDEATEQIDEANEEIEKLEKDIIDLRNQLNKKTVQNSQLNEKIKTQEEKPFAASTNSYAQDNGDDGYMRISKKDVVILKERLLFCKKMIGVDNERVKTNLDQLASKFKTN